MIIKMTFILTADIILEDAQRIHLFSGDGSYALSSFLRQVETVLSYLKSNEAAKQHVQQKIVLNKFEGEALNVVQTLGPNPSWEATRDALVNHFGIKETFHQLFQEAFTTKNNIVSYYNHLEKILCKINEKYEYHSDKIIEFGPMYTEKIIFNIFINNIDQSLASVLIKKNIFKLRDAFSTLEREGLIRKNIVKKYCNQQYDDYQSDLEKIVSLDNLICSNNTDDNLLNMPDYSIFNKENAYINHDYSLQGEVDYFRQDHQDDGQYNEDSLMNFYVNNHDDNGDMNTVNAVCDQAATFYVVEKESEDFDMKDNQEITRGKTNLNSILVCENDCIDDISKFDSNTLEYINSFSNLNECVCTDREIDLNILCIHKENDKLMNCVNEVNIIKSSIMIREIENLIYRKDNISNSELVSLHNDDKDDNIHKGIAEDYGKDYFKVCQSNNGIIEKVVYKPRLVKVLDLEKLLNIYKGNTIYVDTINLSNENSYEILMGTNTKKFEYKINNAKQRQIRRIYVKRKRKKLVTRK